jgi:hypothetical protein
MTICNGEKFATIEVDRGSLEEDPINVVGAAMKALDSVLSQPGVLGVGEVHEVDIVQTPHGWALTPSSLEWLKSASREPEASDGNNN